MYTTNVKMILSVALSLLLLVLPAIQARPYENDRPTIPTGRPTTPTSRTTIPTGRPTRPTIPSRECELDLRVLTPSEIGGVFEADNDLVITFRASLQDDVIYSTSSVVSTSDPNTALAVRLSFRNVEGRVVPGIERLVMESAVRLVESTTCQIPDHLNEVFEDLANKLYRCTTNMGMSQLRFSIMYHETVLASAKRICNGAETICTASPKYVYGNGLFICEEDMEELFPEEMEDARRKMAEVKKPKEETTDMSVPRDKRLSFWCLSTGSCGILEGGDWGCCGNYYGCCRFCHALCFGHDAVCTCCLNGHWFCGPDCVPDSWC